MKGISLIAVPRILSDGTRNDVTLVGLNHKMGYRGTVNTLLAFGERGGAVGWRVGDEHAGLAAMFHMMNEARVGVGMGAAALGVTGYLHSLDYARARTQGRRVGDAPSHHSRADDGYLLDRQVYLLSMLARMLLYPPDAQSSERRSRVEDVAVPTAPLVDS